MIRFFSKIRKQLLTEKRLSRYLFYAIGEIFLVVIGILIALSINNWNEDRKSHLREIQLARNIVEDLGQDLVDFQQASDELDNQLLIADRVIASMLNPAEELSYDSIGLIRYSSDFRPVTQRNHYQAVSNLENEFVREQLQGYFLEEDEVLDLFKEYEEIIHQHIRPYLREVGMHNLESLYALDEEDFGSVILKADILQQQITIDKFQQIVFERRLKTQALKAMIDDLMAENEALSNALKHWVQRDGDE